MTTIQVPSKTLSDLVRQTGATSPISPKLQAIMECMEYLGHRKYCFFVIEFGKSNMEGVEFTQPSGSSTSAALTSSLLAQ
ncbi:hypothetical protein GLOIN_2v1844973 [Rhizophagus irregularis DAOM 181602=DAOM 197198]|nr:hypothetical protein GLOIN_2v1844973 [Rhizophagus irregularis DAOM 181602=DAOM 197198]